MIDLKKCFTMARGMKTGIVLLILIGLISALGSIIAPIAFYQTRWFQLLLLLLLVNMTLCTVHMLTINAKHFINNKPNHHRYPGKLGILLIHTGIIAILCGAIMNAYFGQSAQAAILQGSNIDISDALAGKYPFTLQLDEFKVDFNSDGSPAQYYSDITIMENGHITAKDSISVNHPMQYRGLKFYQQDYGYVVRARYINAEGKEMEDLLTEASSLSVPGTDRTVQVLQYAPNFDPAKGLNQIFGKAENPWIIFSVSENSKRLGIGAVKLNEPINIENNTSIRFTGVQPYSVLRVKSDPGLPLVLAGGIMFMSGLTLSLVSGPMKVKPQLMEIGGQTYPNLPE